MTPTLPEAEPKGLQVKSGKGRGTSDRPRSSSDPSWKLPVPMTMSSWLIVVGTNS